jgi:tetratricopeptide (TPR) repeat protein
MLRHPAESVRRAATRELWERWFSEKGQEGLEVFGRAAELIDQGAYRHAEVLLGELIRRYPDYAEAYNQRAIVRFRQRRYKEALADCEEVVRRKPWHFGAWHGKGLCHRYMKEVALAIEALRKSVEVQPYAMRRDLDECIAMLH